MKKYSKPEIVFESFALSVSVSSCEVVTSHPSERQCGIPVRGQGVIFVDETTQCTRFFDYIITDMNSIYNGLCYHVPYESNNLCSS